MPRVHAPLGDRVVPLVFAHVRSSRALRRTFRGGAWLSLLVLACVPACSLSSEGTGHTEGTSPSTPTDGPDAEPGAQNDGPGRPGDGGLDARVPASDGSLDARVPAKIDAAAPPGPGLAEAAVRDAAAVVDAADEDAGRTVDPSSDAGPSDGGSHDSGVPDTGAVDAGLDCALTGAYALRFDFQVGWEGTALEGVIPVLAPGKGVLSIFASLDLRPDAKRKKGEAELAPCGAIIPDFTAGNNLYKGELYSVYIPEAAWESPQMPRWNVGWTSACEQPGCAFGSNSLLALLGARTVPPVPPATESTLELADHDGDGLASVTLLARGPSAIAPSGKAYAYPPLIYPWARVRKMMLAIGVNGKLDGAVSGCGAISGTVTQAVIEQGAVACTGVVDANGNGTGAEQTCSADFVTFLDDNMPHWTVTSASFKAQRISSLACAAVRAAL